jgi:hypothetical protein
MAEPLDPDEDTQRRLLRKSEATAKGGSASGSLPGKAQGAH